MARALYLDEPSKTEEVLKSFECLRGCHYLNKNIGSSGQEEVISCDCAKHLVNGKNIACGEDSDCINRLTSVECTNDHNLSCGPDCQNQRFQKKEYAHITVFLTEKKGYGVRADENISQGQFIYEYIGEVIDEKAFRKRMMEYDVQGIKHFYFMMLQKDEFIDATKKGSLARFCNHSCNPNAYVDKWVVGKKLRMGIFAKRDIIKGEEICFDYNVDRYGATAQPCYCGESNCIGFLGGKTQTDSASLLPQALADALSVTTTEEKEWLRFMRKQNKKFQVKNNDSNINEEFVQAIPMKPLSTTDVPKVMSALMLPNQEPLIIEKLIERIYISDRVENANEINRLLIRMHGYKAFSTLGKELWKQNQKDTLFKMIEILLRWPAMSKNKITSSQIEDVMTNISKEALQLKNSEEQDEGEQDEFGEHITNRDIYEKTQELLSVWNKLQMEYRIRKAANVNGINVSRVLLNRRKIDDEDDVESGNNSAYDDTSRDSGANSIGSENGSSRHSNSPAPRLHNGGRSTPNSLPNAPGNINNGSKKDIRSQAEIENERRERDLQRLKRIEEQLDLENKRLEELKRRALEKRAHSMEKIIEEARRAQEEKAKKEEEIRMLEEKQQELRKAKKLSRKSGSKEVSKETCVKLWHKVFAVYVPNMVRKYEKQIGHDNLKACAKDIVNILSEKEVARHGTTVPPKELKDEKLKRIKDYTRDYMKKWLQKYEQKRKAANSRRGHNSNGNGNTVSKNGHDNQGDDVLKNLQYLVQTNKRKEHGGSRGYSNKRQK